MINLITCFNEETSKNSKNNFYLGNWCYHYNNSENINPKNVLEGYYNDKKKLQKSFDYVEKIYEKLLSKLSKELNYLNSCNLNIQSWRIIIGPWLYSFLISTYDKYLNLNNLIILKKKNQLVTEVIDYELKEVVPKNYLDFVLNFLTSNTHVHFLYSELISQLFINKIEIKKVKKKTKIKNVNYNKIYFKRNFIDKFLFRSKKIKNIFFHDQFFPKNEKALINLKINNINFNYDIFSERNLPFNTLSFDENKRQKKIQFKSNNKFEFFLRENILKFIPMSYLENYNLYFKKIEKVKSYNSSIILSSGAHLMNDLFKIWIAQKKYSKFYAVRHGGSFPNENFFLHKHEIKISEKIITSFKYPNKNYIQLPSIKIRSREVKNFKLKKILLIAYDCPRTIVRGGEFFQSSNILQDFHQKFKFYEKLNNKIKKNFKIRLYPFDYGWSLRARYEKNFGRNIFDKKISFTNSLRETRLAINSYLDTPLSECMAANVPNITILLKDRWPIDKSFLTLFKDMKKNKLVFFDSVSASKQMNKIYEHEDEWWSEKKIQNLVKNYRELLIFGKIQNTLIRETWQKFLQKQI